MTDNYLWGIRVRGKHDIELVHVQIGQGGAADFAPTCKSFGCRCPGVQYVGAGPRLPSELNGFVTFTRTCDECLRINTATRLIYNERSRRQAHLLIRSDASTPHWFKYQHCTNDDLRRVIARVQSSTSKRCVMSHIMDLEVECLKKRLEQLNHQDAELTAQREAVRLELALVNEKLNTCINTPVPNGHDPTLWLPDEILQQVLLELPVEVFWNGVGERVCRRWKRILRENLAIKRRKHEQRWKAYDAGIIKPRILNTGHAGTIWTLAMGLDGKMYSGSEDGTIRVWSGVDGHHLQTLNGHTDWVGALAVGLDGKIYSGSFDCTIRVWSGVDGTHLQTLTGHTSFILCLAMGLDGKIYSGSCDNTIRVWSGVDGSCLQTLIGHTNRVTVLVIGLDGKLYSGSYDSTIRVWSGVDGTHLNTLVGHSEKIDAIALNRDGNICSKSMNNTIVWSGKTGARLFTYDEHTTPYIMIFPTSLFEAAFYDTAKQVWSKHNRENNISHITAAVVTPDGWVCHGTHDKYIWIW